MTIDEIMETPARQLDEEQLEKGIQQICEEIQQAETGVEA